MVKINRQSSLPSVATTTLAGNSGSNTLNASGLESTLVQGLAGNDTITLARVDDDAEAGEGNDTVGLTATGTQVNNVSGGAGNDSITFLSATVFTNTVGGGEGDDLVTVGSTGDTSLVSAVQIAGNQGNDTISFTSGARTIVNSYVGLAKATTLSTSVLVLLSPPLMSSVERVRTP